MVAPGGFDAYTSSDVRAASGFYTAGQSYDPNGNLYSSNGYVAVDGTSFAAPLVAGAAALVKQAHPTWTADQIRSALVNNSAQDVTSDVFSYSVDPEWMGAGRLDASAAVAAKVDGNACHGFVWLLEGGDCSCEIDSGHGEEPPAPRPSR